MSALPLMALVYQYDLFVKIGKNSLLSAFFDINQKQTMNVKKYGYIKLRDAASVSGTPQFLDSDGFPRQLNADPCAKTGTALHRDMIGCVCVQPQTGFDVVQTDAGAAAVLLCRGLAAVRDLMPQIFQSSPVHTNAVIRDRQHQFIISIVCPDLLCQSAGYDICLHFLHKGCAQVLLPADIASAPNL